MATVDPPTADVLEVTIDRNRSTPIDAPATHTTTSDFTIKVNNVADPVHVHLSCDDDLAPILDVETGNHFIRRQGSQTIPVRIRDGDRPVRGKLRLSVAYGADTAYIEVRVLADDTSGEVQVSEELAQPIRQSATTESRSLLSQNVVLILLLAVGIVLVAILAVLLGMSTSPLYGLLVVVMVLVLTIGVFVLASADQV